MELRKHSVRFRFLLFIYHKLFSFNQVRRKRKLGYIMIPKRIISHNSYCSIRRLNKITQLSSCDVKLPLDLIVITVRDLQMQFILHINYTTRLFQRPASFSRCHIPHTLRTFHMDVIHITLEQLKMVNFENFNRRHPGNKMEDRLHLQKCPCH